ncbi:Ig-like domain-containing protein [uncultured Bartonella sp.]|uniref:Ig-like domain-containing protein n=1 Tax=uncultured Bartonella sp. TaxID=104108 RepID=UPI002605C33B|nr:Ig-like domain-containing protein [uncultured Bartonella sp.]
MAFFLWMRKIAVIAMAILAGFFLSAAYGVQTQDIQSPSFESFFLNEQNYVVVVGKATANSTVEVVDGARQLGEASADSDGNFTITLTKILGVGEYHLVLRATDKSGKSVTSLQTVTVFIPENKNNAMAAVIHDPTGANHFISDDFSIIHIGKNSDKLFDVARVTYKNDTLTILGHAEKNTQVIATLGNTRLGRNITNSSGKFSLSRLISLFPGDHFVRLDLFNEAGETIDILGIPFRTGEGNHFFDQVYYRGKPMRTIIVKKGDTLSSIARKIYGSSRYEKDIYWANSMTLKNQNHIRIGQELILPIISGKEQNR